jgi:hypothetical protein
VARLQHDARLAGIDTPLWFSKTDVRHGYIYRCTPTTARTSRSARHKNFFNSPVFAIVSLKRPRI